MRISKKRWEDLQEYLVWLESKAKENYESIGELRECFRELKRDVNNLLAQRSVDVHEKLKDKGDKDENKR